MNLTELVLVLIGITVVETLAAVWIQTRITRRAARRTGGTR